jgi:hypothetical protein
MAITGNLPTSTTINDNTTQYFNNFFNPGVNVTQNVDDSLVGFFQSITGNKDSGRTLAASVLYTASSQGLDVMSFIDELRSLKKGGRIEHKEQIDSSSVNAEYNTYQDILLNMNDFMQGQLFYTTQQNVFYKLHSDTIVAVTGYKADRVVVSKDNVIYQYFILSYTQEQNELNAYLTLLLNLNRVNTSLLGLSNSPQLNKYIARAILP